MDDALTKLATKMEYMQMDITVLRQALKAAGIEIPQTRHELAEAAKADERKMEEAARRNE